MSRSSPGFGQENNLEHKRNPAGVDGSVPVRGIGRDPDDPSPLERPEAPENDDDEVIVLDCPYTLCDDDGNRTNEQRNGHAVAAVKSSSSFPIPSSSVGRGRSSDPLQRLPEQQTHEQPSPPLLREDSSGEGGRESVRASWNGSDPLQHLPQQPRQRPTELDDASSAPLLRHGAGERRGPDSSAGGALPKGVSSSVLDSSLCVAHDDEDDVTASVAVATAHPSVATTTATMPPSCSDVDRKRLASIHKELFGSNRPAGRWRHVPESTLITATAPATSPALARAAPTPGSKPASSFGAFRGTGNGALPAATTAATKVAGQRKGRRGNDKTNKKNGSRDPPPLIRPGIPPTQLEDGSYERPKGRPYAGYVWDSETGVWILSSSSKSLTMAAGSGTGAVTAAHPTLTMASLTSEVPAGSDGTVIQPRVPPTRELNGSYRRPKGRAVQGCYWDSLRGVWVKLRRATYCDSLRGVLINQPGATAPAPPQPFPAPGTTLESLPSALPPQGSCSNNGERFSFSASGNCHPKPRGRAPKGCSWDAAGGRWVAASRTTTYNERTEILRESLHVIINELPESDRRLFSIPYRSTICQMVHGIERSTNAVNLLLDSQNSIEKRRLIVQRAVEVCKERIQKEGKATKRVTERDVDAAISFLANDNDSAVGANAGRTISAGPMGGNAAKTSSVSMRTTAATTTALATTDCGRPTASYSSVPPSYSGSRRGHCSLSVLEGTASPPCSVLESSMERTEGRHPYSSSSSHSLHRHHQNRRLPSSSSSPASVSFWSKKSALEELAPPPPHFSSSPHKDSTATGGQRHRSAGPGQSGAVAHSKGVGGIEGEKTLESSPVRKGASKQGVVRGDGKNRLPAGTSFCSWRWRRRRVGGDQGERPPPLFWDSAREVWTDKPENQLQSSGKHAVDFTAALSSSSSAAAQAKQHVDGSPSSVVTSVDSAAWPTDLLSSCLSDTAQSFLSSRGIETAQQLLDAKATDLGRGFNSWRVKNGMKKCKERAAVQVMYNWKALLKKAAKQAALRRHLSTSTREGHRRKRKRDEEDEFMVEEMAQCWGVGGGVATQPNSSEPWTRAKAEEPWERFVACGSCRGCLRVVPCGVCLHCKRGSSVPRSSPWHYHLVCVEKVCRRPVEAAVGASRVQEVEKADAAPPQRRRGRPRKGLSVEQTRLLLPQGAAEVDAGKNKVVSLSDDNSAVVPLPGRRRQRQEEEREGP